MQLVLPPRPLALDVTNVTELPQSEREDEARRIAAEEARKGFDLARGPLLRAALLRLGAAGSRPASDDASHRFRRLVGGDSSEGARGDLLGLRRRTRHRRFASRRSSTPTSRSGRRIASARISSTDRCSIGGANWRTCRRRWHYRSIFRGPTQRRCRVVDTRSRWART